MIVTIQEPRKPGTRLDQPHAITAGGNNAYECEGCMVIAKSAGGIINVDSRGTIIGGDIVKALLAMEKLTPGIALGVASAILANESQHRGRKELPA